MLSRDFDRALNSSILSLTVEEKEEFAIYRMKTLFSIRQVKIDWGLLEAATTRWDPVNHVFCFGDHELTPLSEEFSAIAGWPIKAARAIPDMSPGFHKQYERLLGLTKQEAITMLHGKEVDLTMLIQKFAPPSGDVTVRRYKRRALCLCSLHRYYLVNSKGHIGDASLVTVVEQLEQDRTPMPLIVGETLVTLDRLKRNPRDAMGGSPLLLQIWLQEHLSLVDPPLYPANYKVQSFASRRKSNMQPSFQEWNRYFTANSSTIIRWSIPWWKLTHVAIAPYRYTYLRLISMSQTTFTFPSRVMRQMGRKQLIPNEDTIAPVPERLSPHLLHTWAERWVNNQKFVVLANPETVKVSAAYKVWMAARDQRVRSHAREREEAELVVLAKRKADTMTECNRSTIAIPKPKPGVAPSKYGRRDDHTISPAFGHRNQPQPWIVIRERGIERRPTEPLIVYGRGKAKMDAPFPHMVRSKRNLVWTRNNKGESSTVGASKAVSKIASQTASAVNVGVDIVIAGVANEGQNPTGVAPTIVAEMVPPATDIETDKTTIEVATGEGEKHAEVVSVVDSLSGCSKDGLDSWEATWAEDGADTAMSESQDEGKKGNSSSMDSEAPIADTSKDNQD